MSRALRTRLIQAAHNYALSLKTLNRFEEVKSLLRKTLSVARRVFGDSNDLTLKMRWVYAEVLYKADGATLDDLRESVTTLEDLERTTRRVMGGAHPITGGVEITLRNAQAALVACETPSPPGQA